MQDLEFTIAKSEYSNSTLYQIVNESEGCTLGYQVTVPNAACFSTAASMDSFAITCLCDQIRSDLYESLKNLKK